MSRLFLTKRLIEIFAEEAFLSDQEIFILMQIAKKQPYTKIAADLNYSSSSLDKKIKTLKQKYDFVAGYMEELPDRSQLFSKAKAIDFKPKKQQ